MADSPLQFTLEKRLKNKLGRAGVLKTPHGVIHTPAFVTVGTKATVKALTPEQVASLGAEVVLANTYHLYLQPGDDLVKEAGGLHAFMHWDGPMMTDSGGFQAFSLGAAYGYGVSKVAKEGAPETKVGEEVEEEIGKLAQIDEDGVTFKSHLDGSTHKFTAESSIAIQHNLGADMIFAFDECTSPNATYEYQKEALDRTHRWAKRSLDAHKANKEASAKQGLLGIVQGGRFEDLRKESAKFVAQMDFDGFGIGGSFIKEDIDTAVGWVTAVLPEDKPRHLLGIGEPSDILGAIEAGCDLFDCVAPTRLARTASLYTKDGRINMQNAKYVRDFASIEEGCGCYTCQHYTRAYLSHLYRAKEMLGATLGSIHNLYFLINMVKDARQTILDGTFEDFKTGFLSRYYKTN